MISLILYGRNDSYGYNLHKRAALSLNCMAEVLTEPSDEVIFVDYNTPDDYPTFPEAIQDTLTERAKKLLRILRVRPSVHARFAPRTHLFTLEPIARNIAVRHSDPSNRWLLSTNTDMIFVPRDGISFSALVKDLPRGLYHLPRFEIPETLWETFDRKDPLGTIDAVRHWGRAAHLNEIVLDVPFVRFDGPGDFQLIERDDLFRIRGFDEDMLLGWHVDSNVAKRLYLLYGKTGDLLDRLYGYHCDHTRQVTPMHRADSVTNDYDHFVNDVVNAELRSDAWGCPDDEIEEIRLDRTRNKLYLEGLKAVIPEEMTEPSTSSHEPETYNHVPYDPAHVLPFLADIFVNAPQGTKIAWIGADAELFRLFADLWPKMELGGDLLLEPEFARQVGAAQMAGVTILDFKTLAASADAFIFNFAFDGGHLPSLDGDEWTQKSKDLLGLMKLRVIDVVRAERDRMANGKPLRRVVFVNAIHNNLDALATFVGVARTPFSSRIRQGFVLPEPADKQMDWTRKMHVGTAGIKLGAEIRAQKDEVGHVIFGPYLGLLPGRYLATISFAGGQTPRPWYRDFFTQRPVYEVVAGKRVLATCPLTSKHLRKGRIELKFSVKVEEFIEPDFGAIEVRLWSPGTMEFGIGSVRVSELS